MKYLQILILFSIFFSCSHKESKAVMNSISNDPIELSQQLLDYVRDNKDATPIVNKIAQISEEDLKSLKSDGEKLTFWINIYNGLTQYTLVKDPAMYDDRDNFFKSKFVNIANRNLSLDDIEHGLLRRSRNKLSLGYLPKLFVSKFERQNRVKNIDPRIHFALNCGAKSCPPIVIYDEATIDEQLDESTKNYLKSEVKVDGDTVYTSSLMSWFRADFGGKKGIRKFLAIYDIIEDGAKPTLKFQDYDWSLDTGNYTNDEDFEIKPFSLD